MRTTCVLRTKDEALRLLDSVDHVLTDCDGVLYHQHSGTVAGAVDVVSRLREMGKKVIFVTNNATVSRAKVTEALNGMGFNAAVSDVFTASFLVAEYLRQRDFKGKVGWRWSQKRGKDFLISVNGDRSAISMSAPILSCFVLAS